MKKTKTKILTVLVLILLAGIYYYVKLPAINIHADGFWMFLLVVISDGGDYSAKRISRLPGSQKG